MAIRTASAEAVVSEARTPRVEAMAREPPIVVKEPWSPAPAAAARAKRGARRVVFAAGSTARVSASAGTGGGSSVGSASPRNPSTGGEPSA